MKYFIFLTLTLLLIPPLFASVISIPSEIDFNKSLHSFRFNSSSRSISGKKESYQIWLKADGKFYFSGLYVGTSPDACTSEGGEAQISMDDVKRTELIKLAVVAYNENVDAKNFKKKEETGASLFVEAGEQHGLTNLIKGGEGTKKFKHALAQEIEQLFAKQESRQYVLKMETLLEDGRIVVTLTNQGSKAVLLAWPKVAGEHFFFQGMHNGETVAMPLEYLIVPKNKSQTILPGKNVEVVLKKPADLDFGSGVVIYDNLSDVYDRDRQIASRPKVHLCSKK